jgi:hypothetical protein
MRGAGIADELLTASIQYIINVAMVSYLQIYEPKVKQKLTLFITDSARHSLPR